MKKLFFLFAMLSLAFTGLQGQINFEFAYSAGFNNIIKAGSRGNPVGSFNFETPDTMSSFQIQITATAIGQDAASILPSTMFEGDFDIVDDNQVHRGLVHLYGPLTNFPVYSTGILMPGDEVWGYNLKLKTDCYPPSYNGDGLDGDNIVVTFRAIGIQLHGPLFNEPHDQSFKFDHPVDGLDFEFNGGSQYFSPGLVQVDYSFDSHWNDWDDYGATLTDPSGQQYWILANMGPAQWGGALYYNLNNWGIPLSNGTWRIEHSLYGPQICQWGWTQDTFVITEVTALGEPVTNNFVVFSNPVTAGQDAKLIFTDEFAEIQVVYIAGQVVKTIAPDGSHRSQIPTGSLPSGIYEIIGVPSDGSETLTRKLLIR